jgi:predicted O-linked N-acetylglucosamine transferase (SPINDLY family)
VVLWLLASDPATDERLRQRAVDHGISADRLVFAARVPNAEHLARYPLADLFLDTWPYGAHTTASDALWMGLPVLTMPGHSFASRVCASLVRAAGLGELACDSPETYEDRAVELATRPGILHALRDRLRSCRDHCTLFDMPLLVARLESLYQQMWNEYLAGRNPQPDLTNLGIYHEIGGGLDHAAADVEDQGTYDQKYTTALAYRDSVWPLSPDRRLWLAR